MRATSRLGRKEAEEFAVNAFGDLTEVRGVAFKLEFIAFHHDEAPLVGGYPMLVEVVEPLEVVDAHGLLKVASALFDVRDESRNRGFDVNHEIGQLDERHHEIKQVGVVLEVAVAHHPHLVEIGGKDASVLKDGAVLDDGVAASTDGHNVFETLVEKIDLQVERPSVHVLIEVFKIRIEVYRFEEGRPVVVLGEHFGQRGLSAADVSGYGNVHGGGVEFGGRLGVVEEAEELGIDAVHDARKVGGVLLEVEGINLDDEDAAGVFFEDKLVVAAVEIFEVVDGHCLLVVASALLDVVHQVGHRGAEVDHQVGRTDHGGHRFKQFHIGAEVAVVKVAHVAIVGRKDVDAFEDAAILYNVFFRLVDGQNILEPLFEKEHFEVERPPRHVLIEIVEIGVLRHRLKLGRPAVMLGKKGGQRGFSAADVAGYGDVHKCQ